MAEYLDYLPAGFEDDPDNLYAGGEAPRVGDVICSARTQNGKEFVVNDVAFRRDRHKLFIYFNGRCRDRDRLPGSGACPHYYKLIRRGNTMTDTPPTEKALSRNEALQGAIEHNKQVELSERTIKLVNEQPNKEIAVGKITIAISGSSYSFYPRSEAEVNHILNFLNTHRDFHDDEVQKHMVAAAEAQET